MAKVISVFAPTPHQRDKYLNRLYKDEWVVEKLNICVDDFHCISHGLDKIQYLNMFANREEAFFWVCKLYNEAISTARTFPYEIVILTPSPFELGLMYSKVALWTHKPTTMSESNVKFDLDACFYFAEHRGGIFDESIDQDITSLDCKLRAYKTKLTHLIENASHYNIPLVKIKGKDKYEKFVHELIPLSLTESDLKLIPFDPANYLNSFDN